MGNLVKYSRNFFLFLTSLLCFHYLSAQITRRDLLEKSASKELTASLIPQGQFKPFPQTPAGWKALLPDSVISGIIKRGEDVLGKEFKNIPATIMLEYKRNGNRSDYEKISFGNRDQLWNLVLAEAMEGKRRFTDQIVNGIWAICEESFWGVSAHVGIQKAGVGLPDVEDPIVDLFAAETGALLAWTDYFVGDELDKVSKLIRPRISYEIKRRILVPMTTAKYGWMGGGNPDAIVNNWAPWIASNYIAANLLIEKDEAKRTQGLNIAIRIIDQYLNGLGADGGCDEGPSYWTAAGACVFDALNLLYDATHGRVNIYKDPFIQKMGSYIYKTHIAGNYFINVADAHPTLEPDGIMIFRFGKDMDDPQMKNFGSWAYHAFNEGVPGGRFHRTRSLYDMLAIKDCSVYPHNDVRVPDVWFSDVQLMASRSGNGLFVATHAGNNGESHNHNDVGDFMVYANGYPVIIDVGSGTYTARTFSKDRYKLWFNTSPYHNLPTINQNEQQSGKKFEATDVKYQQEKNYSQLSMDIAKAYPAEAGVKSWLREVKMNKAKDVIEVKDQYVINNNPQSLTQSFMTVCSTDISTPGKIIFILPNQSKVYLDYDKKLWSAAKEEMELTTPEDEGLKHSWDGKDIWRILLTGKSLKTHQSTAYKIHK